MRSTFSPSHPTKPGTAAALQHLLRFLCCWTAKTSGYFPFHDHPVIEFVYHPSGTGVTTLGNGMQIAFEPFGTVIYPAWLQHDQKMATVGTDICLHVHLTEATEAMEKLFSQAYYIPPLGSGHHRGDRYVHSEFIQLARIHGDPSRQTELDLRTTALATRLFQLGRPVDQAHLQPTAEIYRERARRYIRENYATIASAREVAAHVGVSEDYLRHLFLEDDAPGLSQQLNQVKAERAKELLAHSMLPLKDIAAQCGYRNERYFSTRFKSMTHLSPGTFRHQLRASLRA